MSSTSTSETPKAEAQTDGPRFKLYYWTGFPGRGEFMRLVFAETATEYNDVYDGMSFQEIKKYCYEQKNRFAVPAIEDMQSIDPATGEAFALAQTPAIMAYLAEQCDNGRLMPSGVDRHKAAALMADVVDAVEEGCRAWHALDTNAGYSEQHEATRPFIDYFVQKRLPKWVSRFDKALRANPNNAKHPAITNPDYVPGSGEEPELFLLGDSISYVDLAVFYNMDGLRSETDSADGVCAKAFEQHASALLRSFVKQIEERPRIAARLKARAAFSQTGPCF